MLYSVVCVAKANACYSFIAKAFFVCRTEWAMGMQRRTIRNSNSPNYVSSMIREFRRNRRAEVKCVYVYVKRVLNEQPTHVSCMCILCYLWYSWFGARWMESQWSNFGKTDSTNVFLFLVHGYHCHALALHCEHYHTICMLQCVNK